MTEDTDHVQGMLTKRCSTILAVPLIFFFSIAGWIIFLGLQYVNSDIRLSSEEYWIMSVVIMTATFVLVIGLWILTCLYYAIRTSRRCEYLAEKTLLCLV